MLTPETWDDFAALVEANNGERRACASMPALEVDALGSVPGTGTVSAA
jgi:hypothetical protein